MKNVWSIAKKELQGLLHLAHRLRRHHRLPGPRRVLLLQPRLVVQLPVHADGPEPLLRPADQHQPDGLLAPLPQHLHHPAPDAPAPDHAPLRRGEEDRHRGAAVHLAQSRSARSSSASSWPRSSSWPPCSLLTGPAVRLHLRLRQPGARARSSTATWASSCMGAAFIAIGIFFSSLTENQIVAAILTFGALLLFWILNWAASAGRRASGRRSSTTSPSSSTSTT